MTRVPLAVAASVAEVQPATIRKWVQRGIIRRYVDGYDLYELLHWIDSRNPDALYSRDGIKPEDRPGVSLAPQ